MKPTKNRRVLIAGLAVFTLLLIAVNATLFYQDGLGDDFWGGREAPRLRVAGAGDSPAHWFYDVKAGVLDCPRFIGSNEQKNLSLELVNTTDAVQTALVQAFISAPGAEDGLQKTFSEYEVAPNTKSVASWQVAPENLMADGAIRVRIYGGNKAGNAYGETRLCTIRRVQIGPFGGSVAGYGAAALLLAGFWLFWFSLNSSLDLARMNRSDRDAWRVFAVVLTVITVINLFGSGLGMRMVNLIAILIVAVFVLRPTETLHRVN